MLRLATDENFNNNIVRGLLRRNPRVDLLRIQDTDASRQTDPVVLDWAASENRVLLTHDASTIPDFAYQSVERGLAMPGVFVVIGSISVSRAIDDLSLLIAGSLDDEWIVRICYLPL